MKEKKISNLRLGLLDIKAHREFKQEVLKMLNDPNSKMNQLGIKLKDDGNYNILYCQVNLVYGDLVKYGYDEKRLVIDSIKKQVLFLDSMWPTRISFDPDNSVINIATEGVELAEEILPDEKKTLSYIVFFFFVYDVLSVRWIVWHSLWALLFLGGLIASIIFLCRLL